MNEIQVRKELVHTLEEWGVNDLSKKHHADFRSRVLREGVAQFRKTSRSATFEHLRHERFPKDYEEAIRHFMTCELESAEEIFRYSCIDRLDDVYDVPSFAPYFRVYSRSDPTKVFGYRIRPAFSSIPKSRLDPFVRFRFRFSGLKVSESIWQHWFLGSDAAALGMIFEAILASHAIHNEACFECKSRNSLRWNGGWESSWMDLVCTFCNSTCEIKTKASMEKCETVFEHSNLRGGLYANYWKHRNAIRDKHQKMFLVILPREWTLGRNGKRIRPVSCVEIDSVSPELVPSCFLPEQLPPGLNPKQREQYENLSIRGRVVLKASTKAKWFDLEKWEPPIDYGIIMEELFIARYSRKEFDRIETMFCGSEDEDESGDCIVNDQTQTQEQPESTVSQKEALLEKLKDAESVENWEDRSDCSV
ncbi:hypothetical protein SEMRO_2483_G328930.1 [Seminavis robusta]|uniref:Uncharacterized protein n=1 Tax=Seminavis robusta TaxID=568900 RepID=A0A9N8EY28_9STRA|nr:hypothetical protein SEMRO_2483_G328930.1 [Seminavis robusta]|eukprot:Sro2483_g328930.1 n/a (420) ;mRNA; f:4202-5461